ncbi:MAG: hypothetical protein GYA12_13990 [Chloroflexi bacterium]|nr:hypothetical protein [Chloroflexota bacterium]
MIDTVSIARDSQSGQLEYVISSRYNNASDWYYSNHFYGDPVMPGSLGVETILQAFSSGIKAASGKADTVRIACGHEMKWKYRGQVLPTNKKIYVDILVTDVKFETSGTLYRGSANLWADNLRIYEIHNIALIQLSKED